MIRLPFLALSGVLLGASALVQAQDADPRAVLEASTQAIAACPGFSAQFRMTGDGSDMIKSTMPSMSGRFVFGRADAGPVVHILGEARDRADAPSYAFDIARTPDKFLWTDDAAKTVFVRRAEPEPRELPGAGRMIHLVNLLADQPYAKVLARAESVAHEGVKPVAGEACDVVLVTLAKGQPARGGPSHTHERWFIGVSDKLPRRVEQVTDAGMIKFSLVTELSNLSVGEQAPAMLDVRRPEGYAIDDKTVAPVAPVAPAAPPGDAPPDTADPAETDDSNATPRATTSPNTDPPPERGASAGAPAFSFTDTAGARVDNRTQAGRVTVLYFWGTWCIPCRVVSPEVSALAGEHAGHPVDVFALAVRERDPDAARAYVNEQGYKQRLVLDADEAAGLFRVRVYPTIVVIGPDGDITYQGSPSRDRTPEQLVEQAAAAVEQALPGE